MNIYQTHGFQDREDYLKQLAADYDVDLEVVLNIASLLGEGEDFDGLITFLEDLESEGLFF